MSVVWMVIGALTDEGATFSTSVDGGGPVRVAVANNAGMVSPVFTSSQAVDAQGVAKVSITGLDANTNYWWQVEDNGTLDETITGRFTTLQPTGSVMSFRIAAASCAGLTPSVPGVLGTELDANRVSNHPVFGTILAHDPLMFVHMGDLHYYDLGDAFTGDLTNYRRGYDDTFGQPEQLALYSGTSLVYAWDDHDYGPNNADGTLGTKANAAQVYRECVPHYTLPDSDMIYHSWQIGRILCVILDVRYDRSPNSDPDTSSKSILGTTQKTWLTNLLQTSDASVLMIFSPSQWLGVTTDGWPNFTVERDELVDLLEQLDWLDRMVMIYGDRHALGICSGTNNPYGGFPILQAASMDSAFDSDPLDPDPFDVLGDTPGRNQYGIIDVTDNGTFIQVTLRAYAGSTEQASHTVAFNATSAPGSILPALVFADAITGSHRVLIEARVVTEFQSGDDPDGIEIPVIDGDVTMDGTADIFATCTLQTIRDLWPIRATDLLAPYGNEIFIRRGVDLGGDGPLWSPLGYFRIDDIDNPSNLSHVDLSGSDRMAGIVDARFMEPRQFASTDVIGLVIAVMVAEIYPDVEIVWDDATFGETLGRDVVSEESRYEFIRDILTSFGKVCAFDGSGRLQIFTPPEPTIPRWILKAGWKGVLLRATQSLSRNGVYNAVVARGEGADVEEPVQAIAIDDSPSSPTRFGGPFGQVPRFYSSPLITSEDQAFLAARTLLTRNLGLTHNVRLIAIPNPALRPWDPIRVILEDNTRSLHIPDVVRIPLNETDNMDVTLREQARVLVVRRPTGG